MQFLTKLRETAKRKNKNQPNKNKSVKNWIMKFLRRYIGKKTPNVHQIVSYVVPLLSSPQPSSQPALANNNFIAIKWHQNVTVWTQNSLLFSAVLIQTHMGFGGNWKQGQKMGNWSLFMPYWEIMHMLKTNELLWTFRYFSICRSRI